MSRFYLLPSRPMLGRTFASLLGDFFPGLHWHARDWSELAEVLVAVLAEHQDIFIVYRDELPDGVETREALSETFGAEPGDEVIEVLLGSKPTERTCQVWRLGEAA